LPLVPEWADPVWHLFVILSKNRYELKQRLQENGIETMIHYPKPPHLQLAYRLMNYRKGNFPIAEKLAYETLSLPIAPHTVHDIAIWVGNVIRNH
jgi:dTDP-4-amino-4,6-dideoxygalactose transaminase